MFVRWSRSLPVAALFIAFFLIAVSVLPNANGVVLLNTAWLSAFTIFGAVPSGTLLALFLTRTDIPGRGISRAALEGLLFVPLVAQAAAWNSFLGRGSEWLFGATPVTGSWLNSWYAATLVHSAAAIPWVTLIVSIGLRQQDPAIEEASLLESSRIATLRRLVLPQIGAYAAVASCWVGLMTGTEIVVTDLFQIRTAAEEVYLSLALGDSPPDLFRHVAPGVVLQMMLAVTGLMIIADTGRRHREPGLRPPLVYSLGRWRWCAAAIPGVVLALLAGVPGFALCLKAGLTVVTESGRSPERVWSMEHFVRILASSGWRFRSEFWGSLQVGGAAATASLILGAILAWNARRRTEGQLLAGFVTVLGISLPGPLVACGVIALFHWSDTDLVAWLYDATILSPCLAITVRTVPIATLVLVQAFRTIPQELLDAAYLDGMSSTTRFVRVVLPLRWQAAFAAWLAALATATADLSASILVLPPNVATVTTRIFGLLHAGVDDQLAGLCLWVTVAAVILAQGVRCAFASRSPVPWTEPAIIRS